MMPANCDTVIPQESTTSNTNGLISFSKDVIRPGENRRLRGEDLQAGPNAKRTL
ncbi:MAG: molybdopterin molybdenumtransferase MoeA, partial [Actinobacteria bacterium]|nr:molybdopterin molybdenumtransferase MoeA [Actinomycetota bacterium]